MESLIKFAEEYGFMAVIALVIVIIGTKSLFKAGRTSVTEFVDSFGPSDELPTPTPLPESQRLHNTSELINHPFFSNAQYRIVVEIPALELIPNKPAKQQLFRDLLTINIKATFDHCQEIARMDMDQWSGEKWAVEVNKRVNSMVTEFHKRAIDSGIPDVVLFKFARWNLATLEMLYDYINVLGNSNVYVNNNSRTNTFFLIMQVLLVTTIGDAERSLKELNGEVAGQRYKNMILED